MLRGPESGLRAPHSGSGRRPPGALAALALEAAALLAAPFAAVAFAIPSRFYTRRRYAAGLREKLGDAPPRGGVGPCLWLHAVSVGEVRTALPLVAALRDALPGWELRVSTTTDTGRELAGRTLPPGVEAFYYPFDLGVTVRRSLRRVRPSAVVLLELELWPNFLVAARRAGVPLLVANGRISARSFPRYRLLGRFGRFLFGLVDAWAVQAPEYALRLKEMGVPAERIAVLGNLKHDGEPRPNDPTTADRLGWRSAAAPVLMGGCTHPGEEEALLRIWSDLRSEFPGRRLVLAPRHVERAAEVEDLARQSGGIPPLRWSRAAAGGAGGGEAAGSPLVLVDVIGELDRFYRLADVVFVGGSLVPRGGHNLLEPARLGKPVLFGPSTENFEEIAAHLIGRGAGRRVAGPEALAEEVRKLLASPSDRERLGASAREAAGELAGATARHVAWILRELEARRLLTPLR